MHRVRSAPPTHKYTRDRPSPALSTTHVGPVFVAAQQLQRLSRQRHGRQEIRLVLLPSLLPLLPLLLQPRPPLVLVALEVHFRELEA